MILIIADVMVGIKKGESMNKVVVLFPVVVNVESDDTLESIMDKGADILSNSAIRPYVESIDGQELYDDEDLKGVVKYE